MGYPIFGPQVRWGTPFLVDFWTQFGANLAPSWATLVQELVLDGLVGLREAQRIDFLGAGPEARTGIGPKTDTTPTRHDTTLIQSITLVGHSVNHSGDLRPPPTR